MRVALYARVSKDEKYDDDRYQDPENQLVILRNYCNSRGWIIDSEYVDKESGANPNRPAFKKVMNNAYSEDYKRNYETIVVWKLDRFSREPLFVVLSYINKLKALNIGLISLTESWLDIRKDNPMSELVLAIMAWASAEERRKISERTKAGINRLKAIGQYHGGRPFKNKQMGGRVSVEDEVDAK